MKVFIGMETSGALRRRFQERGHDVVSCDILPAEDDGAAGHIVGDVFATLEDLWPRWWPDLAIFHPTCTYLTSSAEWAYSDPDFERYPGVGYHQRVKPGTLTGAARRAAREAALDDVRRLLALPIRRKVLENPIGAISKVRKFSQIIQPYQFGDDASKRTGLILEGVSPIPIDPAKYVPPRMVMDGGRLRPRWGNQTDAGQNRLSPSDDRWKDRSRTWPGIADALVAHCVNGRGGDLFDG
jgi:hypothetical protein